MRAVLLHEAETSGSQLEFGQFHSWWNDAMEDHVLSGNGVCVFGGVGVRRREPLKRLENLRYDAAAVRMAFRVLLGVLLLAACLVAGWVTLWPGAEPAYRGRNLSFWLAQGPAGFDEGA